MSFPALMTDLNWNLEMKRSSIVMAQLSLIALSNFEAIQEEE